MNFTNSKAKSTSGEMSAQEWRHLRLELGTRLSLLKSERADAKSEPEIASLDKQIAQLKEQVEALVLEESVQQFVEDAERFVAAQSAVNAALQDDSGIDPELEL